MLVVNRMTKHFAEAVALDDVSFTLKRGEKVGLVGANGSGKSTLLRILLNQDRPDSGSVMWEPGVSAGYMSQQLEVDASTRVSDLLASSHPEWRAAKTAFDAAIAQLAESSDPAALDRYAGALERFENLGGYAVEQQMAEVITGLGIGDIPLDRPVAQLSGGEKTRVSLGSLLLGNPDLLLLDEPTNHLDLPALEWLERWIQSSPRAAIIVSHDRAFLDNTVSRVLALDEFTHQLTSWPGGYSDFLFARQREQEATLARYQDQQDEIARVERDIRELKNRARRTENSTINFAIRKIAKGTARRAIVQERRLERGLAGADHIEKPAYDRSLYLAALARSGDASRRLILSACGVSFHVGDSMILDSIDLEVHGGDRVWLSGPNGSGKTTLLEILAGQLPSSGQVLVGEGLTIGYLRQEHLRSSAPAGQTVLEAMRNTMTGEESAVRAVLDQFLFTGREVMKEVALLSYGERLRLELARIVGAGADALLLDEPTNHLDLPGIEQLQTALSTYRGPLVIVSHDRAFIDALELTTEWHLHEGHIDVRKT